jgi:hypothetical protein
MTKLETTFAENTRKFKKTTTGSAALDDSPLCLEVLQTTFFLVDMFSSRKLQTNIPSVPSQA